MNALKELTTYEKLLYRKAFKKGGVKVSDLVNDYKLSPFHLFDLVAKNEEYILVDDGRCKLTAKGRVHFLSNRVKFFLQPNKFRT